MFWVNPYSQRNQRHRFIYPEPVPAAKLQVAKARPYVAPRRVYTIDAEDWERTQEGLRVLKWQLNDLREYLARRRLGLKYNPDVDNQPRDDRGRWTDMGAGDKGPAEESPKDPGLITRPAFLGPLVGPAIQGGRIAAQKAIEAALTLFAAMSARNTRESTAALEINAMEFLPGVARDEPGIEVGRLTREEVEERCPRRAEVQGHLNEAATVLRRADYRSDAAYGTAIHKYVERRINGPGPLPQDPNFRAETSLLNSGPARYGEAGSKRLDVFENPGTGTVCIHDEKTGRRALSVPEMSRLVAAAHSFYPGTTRVIVTEVRPTR